LPAPKVILNQIDNILSENGPRFYHGDDEIDSYAFIKISSEVMAMIRSATQSPQLLMSAVSDSVDGEPAYLEFVKMKA
jgi:hypothetical protein